MNHGYGSPIMTNGNNFYRYEVSPTLTSKTQRDSSPVPLENLEVVEMLQQHLPTLYMYSIECPLKDVRDHCQKLLAMLEVRVLVEILVEPEPCYNLYGSG